MMSERMADDCFRSKATSKIEMAFENTKIILQQFIAAV